MNSRPLTDRIVCRSELSKGIERELRSVVAREYCMSTGLTRRAAMSE